MGIVVVVVVVIVRMLSTVVTGVHVAKVNMVAAIAMSLKRSALTLVGGQMDVHQYALMVVLMLSRVATGLHVVKIKMVAAIAISLKRIALMMLVCGQINAQHYALISGSDSVSDDGKRG